MRREVPLAGSPFGSYSAVLTSIVALAVIAAAIVSHLIGQPDEFIDNLAFAAFGVVFGLAPALSSGGAAAAAHARLDAIGAPPTAALTGPK
jgi:hypothetical protein